MLCYFTQPHGLPGGTDALLSGDSPLARTPHEQTALERQIEVTDRQIDARVYVLYAADGP